VLFDEDGPLLHAFAPLLAKRMYEGKVRYILNGYSELERKEAEGIVKWAIEASKDVSGEEVIQYKGYKLHCVCRRLKYTPKR
jgi:hypothetical protein